MCRRSVRLLLGCGLDQTTHLLAPAWRICTMFLWRYLTRWVGCCAVNDLTMLSYLQIRHLACFHMQHAYSFIVSSS
jgi:hypothetical protein